MGDNKILASQINAKATGAEINTGTDDTKFATPKAIADSTIPFLSGINRQAIINGNFDVWQRGTSFTTTGECTADRWKAIGNASTFAISKQAFAVGQTDVPNSTKYLRDVVTSVAGTGSLANIQYKIEDVTNFENKTITLSFYAKADSSKNIAIEFTQNFGSGGSPSAQVTTIGVTTVSLTSSWAKHTVTSALPSISGKTLGTTEKTSFLLINFWLDAGSIYNDRTNFLGQQSGTFEIAQVQICEGEVALPFQPKTFDEELRDCQRYYEKSYATDTDPGTVSSLGVHIGQSSKAINSSTAGTLVTPCSDTFKVTKRATPTVTIYSPGSGTSGAVRAGGVSDRTGCTASDQSQTKPLRYLSFDDTSAKAITDRYQIEYHWTAEAEL